MTWAIAEQFILIGPSRLLLCRSILKSGAEFTKEAGNNPVNLFELAEKDSSFLSLPKTSGRLPLKSFKEIFNSTRLERFPIPSVTQWPRKLILLKVQNSECCSRNKFSGKVPDRPFPLRKTYCNEVQFSKYIEPSPKKLRARSRYWI